MRAALRTVNMHDDIDLKILSSIQFDARYSNVELAQNIGLSPTPCWLRVRALEETGIIQNYVTVFDNAQLGYPDTVLIKVALNCCDDQTSARFEDLLAGNPVVTEVCLAAGEYDYYIKVAVTGVEGYERFLRETLLTFRGIRHYRSSFVLRRLKQTYSLRIPDVEMAKKERARKE